MATSYRHAQHVFDWEPSDPVVIPYIYDTNFSISSDVQNNLKRFRFDGGSSPVDHVNQFQDLLYYGISFDNRDWDAICLLLFHFSLADDAFEWYKSLPAQFIFTWDQLVEEFLGAFSPPSGDDFSERMDSSIETSTTVCDSSTDAHDKMIESMRKLSTAMDDLRNDESTDEFRNDESNDEWLARICGPSDAHAKYWEEMEEITRETSLIMRANQEILDQMMEDDRLRETITSPCDVIPFQQPNEPSQLVIEEKIDVQILDCSPSPDLYHEEKEVVEALVIKEREIEWMSVCTLFEVVHFENGLNFRFNGPWLNFLPTLDWKFNKAFYRKPP